jgi:1,2-diacylglycerol 3-alpha-glucosyltransferase
VNIGLFTDTYFPQINGVGTSVHTLYKELKAQGHNVYIFTPDDPKRSKDEDENIIRMPSMPCFFLKSYRMGLLYPPSSLLKMRELKLDIIHTQTEFSLGTFGKLYSKLTGIPLVHTYHTMYEDYVHYIVNGALISRSMAHSFSRIFCNNANAVIAPTQKVKDSLLSYGVTRPIKIIPTGIDIYKFKKENYSQEEIASLRKEYGYTKDTKVLLVLGRIAQEKNIDEILKSMPYVFENNENARLLIVGDGPYRPNLEEIVSSLGINDKVTFAGFKPWSEIGKYYQLADVYLSASTSETQGLTFVEAMAGGIPVVAKKDPCLEGLIENGVSGMMFETDEEFQKMLISLLNDSEKLSEISKNAEISADRYSSKTFGENVAHLYENVLENIDKTYHLPSVAQAANRHMLYLVGKEKKRILKAEKELKSLALKPARAVKNYALSLKNNNHNGGNDL